MSLFVNNLISLLVAQQEAALSGPVTTLAALENQIVDTLRAARSRSEVWTVEAGRADWSDMVPVSLRVLSLRELLPGKYVLRVHRGDAPNKWFTLALGPNVFPSEASALEFVKALNVRAAKDDRQDDVVELLKGADQDDLDELLNALQLSRIAAVRRRTEAAGGSLIVAAELTPDERRELAALRSFRDSRAAWPEYATADIRADPNEQGWGRLVGGVLFPRIPTTPERDPLDRKVWRVARAIPEDFTRVNGEPCRVPPDTVVYYLHSEFKPSERPMRSRAGDLRWYRTGAPDDIIAYRVAPESEATVDLTGTTSQLEAGMFAHALVEMQEADQLSRAYTDQMKNANL